MESLRYSTIVRAFTRVAITDYAKGDVFVPKGARVALFFGAANRDERHYPDPDRFDVGRNPTDQLVWGSGAHLCAGMYLAKLELEVTLEALVEQVTTIEVESPEYGTSRGVFSFNRLPMRIH